MTDPKSKTVWITIPDESFVARTSPSDRVENRVFWGAGFVALAVFAALLFAPQKFAGIMKASLFDGKFQVVPEEQNETNPLFGGVKDDAASEDGKNTDKDSGAVVSENSSQVTDASQETSSSAAPSDAVSIQIDPLPETSAASDQNDAAVSSDLTSTTSNADAESVLPADANVTPTEATDSTASSTATDLNAAFILDLTKQIEAFKAKQEANEKSIQDLTKLVQDQASDLHEAATSQDSFAQVPGAPLAVPVGVDQAAVGSAGGIGAYRFNTHTALLNPYDVLVKNKQVQAKQGNYQANMTYGSAQTYSGQNYNSKLSGVSGTAATGPAESLILALLVASFGMLIWGAVRAARA